MSKLVNCKHCEKEVAKGVKKCPSCGGKLKMGILPKMGIAFVVLIALAAIGGGGATKAPDTPDFKVTALQMAQEFEQNEVAAEAKYDRKWVEIVGNIESIESNGDVYMSTGWSGYFFNLSDIKREDVAKLKTGYGVKVYCQSRGIMLNFISMDSCTVL